MTAVVYVPRDSSAVSLGADAVAEAIRNEAASRKLEVKIRRHNPVGDTLYIDGEVIRTFAEAGAHYAEVSQRAINQDGELSVLATGIIRLPSRAKK